MWTFINTALNVNASICYDDVTVNICSQDWQTEGEECRGGGAVEFSPKGDRERVQQQVVCVLSCPDGSCVYVCEMNHGCIGAECKGWCHPNGQMAAEINPVTLTCWHTVRGDSHICTVPCEQSNNNLCCCVKGRFGAFKAKLHLLIKPYLINPRPAGEHDSKAVYKRIGAEVMIKY